MAPGHRFCAQCGAGPVDTAAVASVPAEPVPPVAAPAEPASPAAAPAGNEQEVLPDRTRWWILGGAVVGGLVFLALPYVWTGWADQGEAPRVPMGAQSALPAPGAAPGVDLSAMTPREAADRLFNRVMAAMGAGDQEEIDAFLPMAIDAYHLVPNLDADGHFHLSLLQQAAGDHLAALETAERVLVDEPDHLLALYAAGEAARGLGDRERAREHFQHVLAVFDQEADRDRPEYREHASFLPAIREAAEEYLAGP
jgi:tetratricopeptide (TPR) repeat protein